MFKPEDRVRIGEFTGTVTHTGTLYNQFGHPERVVGILFDHNQKVGVWRESAVQDA